MIAIRKNDRVKASSDWISSPVEQTFFSILNSISDWSSLSSAHDVGLVAFLCCIITRFHHHVSVIKVKVSAI